MLSKQEVERGRYQYTIDELTRYLTFKKVQHTPINVLFNQIFTCALTSTVAHQLLHVLIRSTQKNQIHSSNKLGTRLLATRRPTEHTFTVFTFKLLLDFLNERKSNTWTGYQVGGITGLLSYIVSRPFDQMDLARGQILKNEKKKISRFEAFKIIIKYDGLKGFYRNQNLLGPFCYTLYRSVYFGLWHKLQEISPSNQWTNIGYFPLLASFGASAVNAIPDKLRSYSLQANEARRQSLQKLYVIKPTLQLLLEYVSSSQFTLSKRDLAIIGTSVIKNWIILSFFALGQHLLKVYSHKNQREQ